MLLYLLLAQIHIFIYLNKINYQRNVIFAKFNTVSISTISTHSFYLIPYVVRTMTSATTCIFYALPQSIHL